MPNPNLNADNELYETRKTDLNRKVKKSDLLKHHNVEALEQFKSDQSIDNNILFYTPPGKFRVTSGRIDCYTKERMELGEGHFIDYIYHTSNVTKDDEALLQQRIAAKKKPIAFVLHTSPENIEELIRAGLYKPESPTGLAIHAIGKYFGTKVTKRAVQDQIVSNRYDEKRVLYNIAQDRIAFLQDLECLVNNYNVYRTSEENLTIIEKMFADYNDTLESYLDEVNDILKNTNISAYYKNAMQDLKDEIVFDQNRARSFIGKFKLRYDAFCNHIPSRTEQEKADYIKNTILAPTGPRSLHTFIKKRISSSLRQIEKFNQNMSYSRKAHKTILRGDLHAFIEEAINTVNNYQADHHNAITPEHQGRFKGDLVAFDSSVHLEHVNPEEVTAALRIISVVEDMDVIDNKNTQLKSKKGVFIIGKNQEEKEDHYYDTSLEKTAHTKWGSAGSKWQKFKKAIAWPIRVALVPVVDIVLSLVYLGVEIRNAMFPESSIRNEIYSFNYYLTRALDLETDAYKQSNAKVLVDAYVIPKAPLYANVIIRVGTMLQRLGIELWRGIKDIFAIPEVFRSIREDYYRGVGKENIALDTDGALKNFRENIVVIDEVFASKKSEIKDFIQEIHHEDGSRHTPLAVPAYHLKPMNENDLLNVAINGTHSFSQVFTVDIGRKHPAAFLVFCSVYGVGAMAILAPGLLLKISHTGVAEYIKYTQIGSAAISHGTMSMTIAAGFTEAKLMVGIYEFMLHGPDSWLIKALDMVESDPAAVIIGAGIAMGIGSLLTYGITIDNHHIEIPWASEHLREDLGSVPYIELSFIGAKVGVLLYEAVKREHAAKVDDTASYNRHDLIELLTEHYRKVKGQDPDNEGREQIYTVAKQLLSNKEIIAEHVGKLKENINENAPQCQKNMERLQILVELEKNKTRLPYLDVARKTEMLMLIENKFSVKEAEAMRAWFYPEKPQSVIGATIKPIINVLGNVFIRPFTAIVTCRLDGDAWKRVLNDIGFNIGKELATVVHGLSKSVRLITSELGAVASIIADFFGNEIFARIEGMIRGDKHSIADATYACSAKLERTYTDLVQKLSQPADAIRKAATKPDAEHVMEQHVRRPRHFFAPIESEMDREVGEDQVSVSTNSMQNNI